MLEIIGLKLGFTGTREQLTNEQYHSLVLWIERHAIVEFHHGCCIGADSAAVVVCEHYRTPLIVGHPPTREACISSTAKNGSHVLREPKDYLARNREIVHETDCLLACPKGPEETRSGTWSTIRYARKMNRPVAIIWPDGKVEE